MDGDELTPHIKVHAPQTPILVLTGQGTPAAVDRLLELGVPLHDIQMSVNLQQVSGRRCA
jgi:DNA-binding NarL/FixJ family response regulator